MSLPRQYTAELREHERSDRNRLRRARLDAVGENAECNRFARIETNKDMYHDGINFLEDERVP